MSAANEDPTNVDFWYYITLLDRASGSEAGSGVHSAISHLQGHQPHSCLAPYSAAHGPVGIKHDSRQNHDPYLSSGITNKMEQVEWQKVTKVVNGISSEPQALGGI